MDNMKAIQNTNVTRDEWQRQVLSDRFELLIKADVRARKFTNEKANRLSRLLHRTWVAIGLSWVGVLVAIIGGIFWW
jgi:hypothetical protein